MSDRRECRYGACDCCEQLPKVKQERAEARAEAELLREGNMHLRRVIRAFIGERDQARRVARECFPYYALAQEHTARALLRQHPWLEDGR